MNCGGLRDAENKITPAAVSKDLTPARRAVEMIWASDVKPKKLPRLWNGRFSSGRVRSRAITPRNGDISRRLFGTERSGDDR